MKKLLLSILTILGIGFSFCSAFSYSPTAISTTFSSNYNSFVYPSGYNCFMVVAGDSRIKLYDYSNNLITNGLISYTLYCDIPFYESTSTTNKTLQYFYIPILTSSGTCEDKDIVVYYNNGNSSTNITCDGVQAIEIQGLSTITSTNIFTPYFNIDYRDEDNQSLIESYSKDILYLSGGNFKKTYTGNNEWILSVQGNSNSQFTGYVPVFDVTGSTDTLNNGNVFNNFSDNALKVLLSNIPSYIQYVTIFFILLFLFGFIRRFKRKR